MKREILPLLFVYLLGLVTGLLSPSRCEPSEREHLPLKVIIPVVTSAAALDLASTEWALHQNPMAYESNPLGKTLTNRAALQMGLVVGESLLVRKLPRKTSKKVLIGIVVLKVGVAGWNVKQGMKAGGSSR